MTPSEALELLGFWDEIRAEVPAQRAAAVRQRYGVSPFTFTLRLLKAARTGAGQSAYPALCRRLISKSEDLRHIRWPA